MLPADRDPETASNPFAAPANDAGAAYTQGRTWPIFLGMGIAMGASFWLLWSILMAMLMRQDLMRILTGVGAVAGLLFGLSMGICMAILMRPATVEIRLGNDPDLDSEMAKLRYRRIGGDAGLRVYGPRTLFRPRAFNIEVRVQDGGAIATGPKANVRALKKRLER